MILHLITNSQKLCDTNDKVMDMYHVFMNSFVTLQ